MSGETLMARSAFYFSATPKASKSLLSRTTMTFGERLTEAELDRQVLAIFDKMRIEDENVRDWFRAVLASKTKDPQADTRAQRAELQIQETLIAAQQDRLLNLRIDG